MIEGRRLSVFIVRIVQSKSLPDVSDCAHHRIEDIYFRSLSNTPTLITHVGAYCLQVRQFHQEMGEASMADPETHREPPP